MYIEIRIQWTITKYIYNTIEYNNTYLYSALFTLCSNGLYNNKSDHNINNNNI